MNRYKLIISTIAIFLVLIACEKSEKIDDFPIATPALVLNSQFSADTNFVFQLSRSLSILDNAELKMITDAKLFLYENDVLIDSIIGANWGPEYISQHQPKIDKSYIILAAHPDYDTITSAVEKLPSSINITDIQYEMTDSQSFDGGWDDFGGRGFEYKAEVKFKIHDVAGEENYYEIGVEYIDSLFDPYDSIFNYVDKGMIWEIDSDDPSVEKKSNTDNIFGFQYGGSTLNVSDKLFDGQTYLFTMNFKQYSWSDMKISNLYLYVKSRNRSGYLYAKTYQAFLDSQYDPFAEPVSVYSNIHNGYGIFAGSEEESQHISEFRINMDWYNK